MSIYKEPYSLFELEISLIFDSGVCMGLNLGWEKNKRLFVLDEYFIVEVGLIEIWVDFRWFSLMIAGKEYGWL